MQSKGARFYRSLQEAARLANSAMTEKETFHSLVKSTSRALNLGGCCLLVLDSGKERLIPVAAYGLSDWYVHKGFIEAEKSLPETLEGKVVTVLEATRDSRVQYPDLAEKAGIVSILSSPVRRGGEIIGAVRVYTHEPHQFSSQERNFVAAMAEIMAIALERAELKEELARREEARPTAHLFAEITRPEKFAHPSEAEFAKLLDFYRIEWLYEPRSFPVQWDGDRVVEWFTPDFYLPELDFFIELTTLRQRSITEKNRKLRRLKELYPEINIKLLTKKDYHRLLAKYGYGPLGEARVKGTGRVLFNQNQVQKRVRELARQISQDYKEKRLLLVGVLKGVVCFMADLMRHISLPVEVDFLAISYYGEGDTGVVKITKDLDRNITGMDVLMVEDIVDTGMTLNYILNHLAARHPASLRVCALLDKGVRRLVNITLDYVGFEIPDEFVVGYGLDYRGAYRNLPFITTLSPELLGKS